MTGLPQTPDPVQGEVERLTRLLELLSVLGGHLTHQPRHGSLLRGQLPVNLARVEGSLRTAQFSKRSQGFSSLSPMHGSDGEEQFGGQPHLLNLSRCWRASCWGQESCDWFPWSPALLYKVNGCQGGAIIESSAGLDLVHLVRQGVLVQTQHLKGLRELHGQVDIEAMETCAPQRLNSMLESSPVNWLKRVA